VLDAPVMRVTYPNKHTLFSQVLPIGEPAECGRRSEPLFERSLYIDPALQRRFPFVE
jgi:hypothetical protein